MAQEHARSVLKWLSEFVARTWLVTLLFTAASMAAWSLHGDPIVVAHYATYTFVIAPGVWFVLAGRRRPIHLLRAMFAGAVIGGWSQSAPFGEWRDILELFSADRSGSLADMAYVLLSALVLVSMVGGAALALLVELGERAGAAHRRRRSQRPSPPQGATLIHP